MSSFFGRKVRTMCHTVMSWHVHNVVLPILSGGGLAVCDGLSLWISWLRQVTKETGCIVAAQHLIQRRWGSNINDYWPIISWEDLKILAEVSEKRKKKKILLLFFQFNPLDDQNTFLKMYRVYSSRNCIFSEVLRPYNDASLIDRSELVIASTELVSFPSSLHIWTWKVIHGPLEHEN